MLILLQILSSEKPTFRQMPDDVVATEDDTIELKCSASGDPRPTIQWQKEEGRIPFGRFDFYDKHL